MYMSMHIIRHSCGLVRMTLEFLLMDENREHQMGCLFSLSPVSPLISSYLLGNLCVNQVAFRASRVASAKRNTLLHWGEIDRRLTERIR